MRGPSLAILWIVSLAVTPSARADWTQWQFEQPGPVFVGETATAPAGLGTRDRCVVLAVTDFVTANNSGEVWCSQEGQGWTQYTQIMTASFASVAMVAPLNSSTSFTPPYFAVSDPGLAQIWYGVTGGVPELAVQGNPGRSLSMGHYSDGTAILVYKGHNDRLYMAARKPATGTWSEIQVTNNTSGPTRWSVDAVVVSDIVHIAYWDANISAVRYGRLDAGGWTFETVRNLPAFVSPAVAGDGQGGAHVAYAGTDGLLHYLRRTGPGTWAETTFAPPLPASYDEDRGPVGFTIDSSGRAHFVYGTGNWGDPDRVLRYVNLSPLGTWADSTALRTMTNNHEGYRGIDLVRKGGPIDEQVFASWTAAVVGIAEVGCADCIP